MSESRHAKLYGECAPWPSRRAMVTLLRAAGLVIVEGRFSIRLADFGNFVFREYGNDIGPPTIDAFAEAPAALIAEASAVSAALTAARVRHRFSILLDDDADERSLAYFHYKWPGPA